jgi:hypothetical protein
MPRTAGAAALGKLTERFDNYLSRTTRSKGPSSLRFAARDSVARGPAAADDPFIPDHWAEGKTSSGVSRTRSPPARGTTARRPPGGAPHGVRARALRGAPKGRASIRATEGRRRPRDLRHGWSRLGRRLRAKYAASCRGRSETNTIRRRRLRRHVSRRVGGEPFQLEVEIQDPYVGCSLTIHEKATGSSGERTPAVSAGPEVTPRPRNRHAHRPDIPAVPVG